MAHAIAKKLEAFNQRVERSMYPGGRPNRVARMLNRGWALVGRAGLGPRRLVTLEVRGRRSGRTISFPLVVADLEGERYLVAMLGERARWVENVRAAGGRVVLRHGQRETVRLEEVEPCARPPILRRYMQVAPGGRAMIQVQPDAPQAEFERIARRYPVFRIAVDPVAQPVRTTPACGSTRSATADAPNQAFEGMKYAKKNLLSIADSAVTYGLSDTQEARFPRADLGAEQTGINYFRVKPSQREAFAHRHRVAEEIYVVLFGSGRVKLDDELVELSPLDAVRVSPGVARAFEAGPDGLEVLIFGPHVEGDGELVPDFWSPTH